MSVSAVSGAIPQYLSPQTPQAKSDDERTESMTIKAREAETGKDAPVQVKKSAVDIKA
jgi:hypothetical protein